MAGYSIWCLHSKVCHLSQDDQSSWGLTGQLCLSVPPLYDHHELLLQAWWSQVVKCLILLASPKQVPRDGGRNCKVSFNSDAEVMQNHLPCILLFKGQASVPSTSRKHKPKYFFLNENLCFLVIYRGRQK